MAYGIDICIIHILIFYILKVVYSYIIYYIYHTKFSSVDKRGPTKSSH